MTVSISGYIASDFEMISDSMIEVNLSMGLINYSPRHEDIWGSGGIAPPFLTSVLYGGECQLHALAPLSPGKNPGTHWIGGWEGPELIWTLWRREESATLARNRTLAVQTVAHCYTSHGLVKCTVSAFNCREEENPQKT
jgi:hypothetical protein